MATPWFIKDKDTLKELRNHIPLFKECVVCGTIFSCTSDRDAIRFCSSRCRSMEYNRLHPRVRINGKSVRVKAEPAAELSINDRKR